MPHQGNRDSRIINSFITSSLCLKVFDFVQCSCVLGVFCVRFFFFLLILQSGWELLTASCRIFCTAVMTFNCAELPQTPVLWAVIPYIKDEREHDSFPFSPILASLLCYLVPGGWYIRTYIHTHTHTSIYTPTHRAAPYWSLVHSEGFL